MRAGAHHHRPALLAVVALAAVVAVAAGARLSAHDGIAGQIETITAQIAQKPLNATLLVRRAELRRLMRHWSLALADLDRAEALSHLARLGATRDFHHGLLVAVDLVRAHVLADAGHTKGAVEAASRVLAREPAHADALIVRARAHARLRLSRQAAADFTHAIERQPLPDLFLERARAISTSRGPDLQAALAGLDEGIGRFGPLVVLQVEAIDLEVRLRRYDAALTRLEHVTRQAARKDTWLARRGEILERADRIDDARTAYGAALAAATSLPPSRQRSRASTTLIERLHANLDRLGHGSTRQARHVDIQ
jgi:tetratricopeptide (TPR) repeat protein